MRKTRLTRGLAAGSDSVHHQAARAEHLLEECAECISDSGARRVCAPEHREDLGPEFGVRQELPELVEGGRDGRIESDSRHWSRLTAQMSRQRNRLCTQRRVENRTRSHFVPVVILRVDPENGHTGDAVFMRDTLRQFQRGQCFEQCEEWTTEKSGLLTCQDRDCFCISEQAHGRSCRLGCTATLLLTGEDAGDLGRLTNMHLSACDRAGPGLTVSGVAGKKRRDGVEVVGVVGGETTDPGKRRRSTATRAGTSPDAAVSSEGLAGTGCLLFQSASRTVNTRAENPL